MRTTFGTVFALLLGLVIFDVGLSHQNSFPGTYAFYGLTGSLLFTGIGLIVSTILKKKRASK